MTVRTARTAASHQDLQSTFKYNPALPLDVKEASVERQDGIVVHDLSYASAPDRRVQAYLVTPSGRGPAAGVIFVHPAPGNRATFLEEATALARHGAACLLIEAPWAQGAAWGQTLGKPETDRQGFIDFAIDIRRAVDLLTSHFDVDEIRIGYVGHSLGALFGGILSGVERRITAFVLMAGTGSFGDVVALNLPSLQGTALERYTQAMTVIDPVHYVGHAAPSALLFQFGLQDQAFGPEKMKAFAEAGSKPKAIKWYQADHFLENERARRERMEWLSAQLSLDRR